MGQTTEHIETDIHKTREDLRSNFVELESKVKSVTDWKQPFRNNPGTMVAAAFGAGALLATMGRGRKRARAVMPLSSAGTRDVGGQDNAGLGRQKHQVLETWDGIKSALVGVAATEITGYLGKWVPGFQEHLNKADSTGKLPPPKGPL
jgi:hypothetical protein